VDYSSETLNLRVEGSIPSRLTTFSSIRSEISRSRRSPPPVRTPENVRLIPF
jgi:hypothetical protein